MKDKSHTRLAARCREKLHDRNWDILLAGRVASARSRQKRRPTLYFTACILFFAGALMLSAWSLSEEQAHDSMLAMVDEVAYPVVGSAFSE